MTYVNCFSQNPLMAYLVQGLSGWQPSIDILPTTRRHDWGFGVRGQQCVDCVLMTQPPGPTSGALALQYKSFAPAFGGVATSAGNGGDILAVSDDGWINIIATMDGGRPGEIGRASCRERVYVLV